MRSRGSPEPVSSVACRHRRHEHALAAAVHPPHVVAHPAPEPRRAAEHRGVGREIGMEAADQRQPCLPAIQSAVRPSGPGVVRCSTSTGLAAHAADIRANAARTSASRRRTESARRASAAPDSRADRSPSAGGRVDPRLQSGGRMRQQRRQRRRDAVDLVEVVVGEDGDAHVTPPAPGMRATSGAGRATRSNSRFSLNRSSMTKWR